MKDFNKIDFLIQRKRIKLIEEYVPANSVLLDIGCGYYAENLISLEKKISQGIGLDKEPPSTPPSAKISFVKFDISKALPFRENEFDCITMTAVLEHLDHPADVARECCRVLKPGGRLIVTIPSYYSKPVLNALAGIGLISKEEIFDHKHYFKKRDLEVLLTDCGLINKVSRYYNVFMNILLVAEKPSS